MPAQFATLLRFYVVLRSSALVSQPHISRTGSDNFCRLDQHISDLDATMSTAKSRRAILEVYSV